MKFIALKYSLYIWLSTFLTVPLILFIIAFVIQGFKSVEESDSPLEALITYLAFTIFSAIFSFATWLIFYLVTLITIKYSDSTMQSKCIISTCGVFISIAIFELFFYNTWIGQAKDAYYLIGIVCFCFTVFSWLYKLDAKEN